MNKPVDAGKTLLVDGPASVTLLSGKAEVFGFQLADARKIVIREGKRLPFTAFEPAVFDLALGQGAEVSEVEGSTIPPSWQAAYASFREVQAKPAIAMVVGGVDSGKSSFCTYLANRLVSDRCRVAVLDEDLGQSDIGPPCTVGYAVLAKPVTDLFTVKPEAVSFVGATSPGGVTTKTLQVAATLEAEILAHAKADYVIVNTDGWANGDEALHFKRSLADALKPSVVFCLQRGNELPIFCGAFAETPAFKVVQVEAPPRVRERDREKRKSLRELGFAKYFDGAKLRLYPFSQVSIEGGVFSRGWDADNLVVGLHDVNRRFLGIGVIRGVDLTRRALRIFSCVEKPAVIVMGSVRLDASLHEIQK